ncbi:radical SAM protein [Deltaproteobacteria bacterium OttesenSCG-928-K17]|nr:radical SAM protein [Deltaproteobacteria bacterium OttesenSCG-928-K17]
MALSPPRNGNAPPQFSGGPGASAGNKLDSSLTARWWSGPGEGGAAFSCEMCFRRCRLTEGGFGHCGARGVVGGRFVSPFLGRFSSAAVDPIEKKPLYHWRPGSFIFSLGSLGCTMHCPFCQNHSIARPGGQVRLEDISPKLLAMKVKELGLAAVAYTYNEPTLQAEYILAAAEYLKADGVATALVTNGQMGPELLAELAKVTGAVNMDVKTFNQANYQKMGGALNVVRENVAAFLNAGVHVELTTLVVPGLSDDRDEFAELAAWAAGLSPDIPLHISRYFPAYKYSAPMTELSVLEDFRKIAAAKLRHVHLGNVR